MRGLSSARRRPPANRRGVRLPRKAYIVRSRYTYTYTPPPPTPAALGPASIGLTPTTWMPKPPPRQPPPGYKPLTVGGHLLVLAPGPPSLSHDCSGPTAVHARHDAAAPAAPASQQNTMMQSVRRYVVFG